MANTDGAHDRGPGNVPVPDPTTLTTEAVDRATAQYRRELASLRELIGHEIEALRGTLTARLDATDESAGLRLAAIAEVRPQTERQINHLRELVDEKFAGIALQFLERDTRSEQEKKAAKEALDAALLAQKESVSQQNDANTTAATKSETSFTKQIDQIGTLIATLEKSLTDRITELKERIDRGEGGTSGAREVTVDLRAADAARQAQAQAAAAATRATISIVVAAVAVLVVIVIAIVTHS